MRVTFEHHSEQEVARSKLEEAIGKIFDLGTGQISQVQYGWAGDTLDFSFAVMSKPVKGSADLTDTEIIVNIGIPIMFRPVEGKVKSRILAALNEIFP